jgi:GWxTD domain-containing protein
MNRSLLRAAVALAAIMACDCFRPPIPKGLDAESAEFLSQVRYIITKEERKSFVRLDPADREGFMTAFWERRDPTPGTERNEFQEDYLRRIDEANLLFKQGSTPGWLQDRGEVYVTLGRPDHRETYPRGIDFYGKPEEIWWYGFFPVVFIDENWTGNYRLTALSAYQIAEITKARAEEKDRRDGDALQGPPELDFELTVEKTEEASRIVIKIPYKAIWLEAADDEFFTVLDVRLIASDRDGATVWEAQKDFQVKAAGAEALKLIDQTYEMRIEADLPSSAMRLTAEVANRTGNSRGRKSLEFVK